MSEKTIISEEPIPAIDDRTAVVALAPDVTQAAILIACPVCRAESPPGEKWCRDCGFLLASEAPVALELPEAVSGARLVGEGDREHSLRAGVNAIGRENAEVLLLDSTVSRRHARLTLEDEAVWIEDDGSTNGTQVNREPLPPGERRALKDGDDLRFGSVALRLALPADWAARIAAAEPAVPAEASPILALLIAADGTEHPLRAGRTTVGRRSDNDLVLTGDPYVSGRHADFRCDDSGCVVIDVGSTNGTFLRDARLAPNQPQSLSPGEEVRLGQSVFVLQQVNSDTAGSGDGADLDPDADDAADPS